MALMKELTNATGITTNYHRVSDVFLHDNNLDCTLKNYVSKDYRDLERHADMAHYDFEITVEEEESMGIRQLCYKKLKELPEWADAIDC